MYGISGEKVPLMNVVLNLWGRNIQRSLLIWKLWLQLPVGVHIHVMSLCAQMLKDHYSIPVTGKTYLHRNAIVIKTIMV